MPTYYYNYDLTSSTVTICSNDSHSYDSWDISEFSNDSRGTPRIADWSDLSGFSASDFDIFAEALNYTSSAKIGLVSHDNYSPKINKYWQTTGRVFYATIGMGDEDYDPNGGYLNTNSISSDPLRILKVGSWHGTSKVLVYFPDYEANGGHETLVVNNNTIVSWVSENHRFESSDGNVTLFVNSTSWIIDDNGTQSIATYNGSNIKHHVDPASSDLTWSNGGSVTIPSAGILGDPHINPILGKPYTI